MSKLLGRVSRTTRVVLSVVAVWAVLAGVIGVVPLASAHTGFAGLLHLGHVSTSGATTTLQGSVSSGLLKVINHSTSTSQTAGAIQAVNKTRYAAALSATNTAGGPALDLSVTCPIGYSSCNMPPPMRVNSTTRVHNLNADSVDGLDSSQLLPLFAKVAVDGTLVGGRGVQQSFYADYRNNVGVFEYYVVFDRDILGCAYTATIGDHTEFAKYGGATIQTQPAGLRTIAVKTIQVETPQTVNGHKRPFTLVVTC